MPGALLGGALGSSVTGVGDVRTPGTVNPPSMGTAGIPNAPWLASPSFGASSIGAPLDPGALARAAGFSGTFGTPSYAFDGTKLTKN